MRICVASRFDYTLGPTTCLRRAGLYYEYIGFEIEQPVSDREHQLVVLIRLQTNF